jgi:crossover junction endodeoxyribonuclease RuvC
VADRDLVVLGVDPGTRVAGWSVVVFQQGRAMLVDYGALTMSGSLLLSQRVGMFYNFFDEKMVEHHVNRIALETPFLGKNAQTFLKLGYLRGILHLLQDRYNSELCEFSPMEIKRSITGYGAAEKEQVARLLVRLFPTLVVPDKLDITDAIAVGLCGAWYRDNSVLLNQRAQSR